MLSVVAIAAGVLAIVAVIAFVVLRKPSDPSKTSGGAQPNASAGAAGAGKPKSAEEDATLIPVDIYYGSVTGTAKRFGQLIAQRGKKHGIKARLIDLAKYKQEEMTAGKVPAIFMMATCGEGDVTENAQDFYRWIHAEDTPSNALSALRFTVFGLGSKQYEKYNWVGKMTNTRLEALGGKRFYPHGEGDESGNQEEEFEQWRDGTGTGKSLWDAIKAAHAEINGGVAASASGGAASASGGDDDLPSLPDMPWTVVPIPAESAAAALAPLLSSTGTGATSGALSHLHALAEGAGIDNAHFYRAHWAVVKENKELRQVARTGESTRHIEVELTVPLASSGSSHSGTSHSTGASGGAAASATRSSGSHYYTTADNLHICPENDASTVRQVASALGYALDHCFTLERTPSSPGDASAAASSGSGAGAGAPLFPSPANVQLLLSRYLDLHGLIRQETLGYLAHYASASDDRRRLLDLSNNREAYNSWARDAQRSIAEALLSFPSLKIPLQALIHIVPLLQARPYTIASSSIVQPTRAAVVVTVIDTPKPHGGAASASASGGAVERRLKGVCSNHMLLAQPGHRMLVFVKPSTFRLPSDHSTPIIMIGPGTGIAPMRAFLQERAHVKSKGIAVGPSILFFGCRKSTEDFIYQAELLEHARTGVLTSLHTAFSREQPEKKVYVQDLIVAQAAALYPLLTTGKAHVYVCGATKMGHDVKQALKTIFITQAGGPSAEEEAHRRLETLKREGRYVEELWSS